jgi:hypothetical protein
MLPKLGSRTGEDFMKTSAAARPSLQDMVKAASAGAMSRVNIAEEALRQQQNLGEEKTASAQVSDQSLSTEQINKLADALDFVAEKVASGAQLAGAYNLKEGTVEVGSGPGALKVMEATSSGSPPGPGQQGAGHHQPPKNPGLEKARPNEHSATKLESNAAKAPGGSAKMLEKNNAADADKLAESNLDHILKIAKKDDPEGHMVRRAILGNPISSAIEAKKGKKLESFGKAYKHHFVESLKGLGKGGLIGGAGGAVAGAAHGAIKGKDLKSALRGAGKGALIGGIGGADIGSIAGSIKGQYGREASKIHGEHSKHKESEAKCCEKCGKEKCACGGKMASAEQTLVDVMLGTIKKTAEDAINPAQISAGAAVAPETSAAGESGGEPVGGAPQGPSGLVGSNQAAIDYKKSQAYANRKPDLSKYLTEPALSSATDKTLQEAFSHTGEAGTKFSSAQPSMKTAAAKALLLNLAEQAEKKAEKEKESLAIPALPPRPGMAPQKGITIPSKPPRPAAPAV